MADPQDSEAHHPPDHYMEDPMIWPTDLAPSPDSAPSPDAASHTADHGSDIEDPSRWMTHQVKVSLRYVSGEQVLPSTGPAEVFIDVDATIGQLQARIQERMRVPPEWYINKRLLIGLRSFSFVDPYMRFMRTSDVLSRLIDSPADTHDALLEITVLVLAPTDLECVWNYNVTPDTSCDGD